MFPAISASASRYSRGAGFGLHCCGTRGQDLLVFLVSVLDHTALLCSPSGRWRSRGPVAFTANGTSSPTVLLPLLPSHPQTVLHFFFLFKDPAPLGLWIDCFCGGSCVAGRGNIEQRDLSPVPSFPFVGHSVSIFFPQASHLPS